MKNVISEQRSFIQNKKPIFDLICKQYSDLYLHTKNNLYRNVSIVDELKYVYYNFLNSEIENIDYVFAFLEKAIPTYSNLVTQISKHALEFLTFREIDLCEQDIIKENIFISTVHKAKGLEFETVIVTDVIDGVYPFFTYTTVEEDARKLYVAISRAQQFPNFWAYLEKVSKYSREKIV